MTGREAIVHFTTDVQDPLASASASEQVLAWFERYVIDHQLDVGDPLPSEDIIVHETGMSRTSVREALTRLRAFGLIDSRRKRGMRLKRAPGLIDLVHLLGGDEPVSPRMIGKIGTMRDALELGLEQDIFQRVAPGHISELRAIFTRMTEPGLSVTRWRELDLRFHEVLIGIAGNEIAVWLLQLFQPFFTPIHGQPAFLSRPAHPELVLEQHRRIIAALESRDPVAFHLVMREHHVNPPLSSEPRSSEAYLPAGLVAFAHAAHAADLNGEARREAC